MLFHFVESLRQNRINDVSVQITRVIENNFHLFLYDIYVNDPHLDTTNTRPWESNENVKHVPSRYAACYTTMYVHYDDVIVGAIASLITSLTIVYSRLFIQTQIKENIKAPRHWTLCGEFTEDRWIPRTNGQ